MTDVSVVRTASIILRAMMEAVRISETSVNFNVTTARENLESHSVSHRSRYRLAPDIGTKTQCHSQ
jgi:hypothetical protein